MAEVLRELLLALLLEQVLEQLMRVLVSKQMPARQLALELVRLLGLEQEADQLLLEL